MDTLPQEPLPTPDTTTETPGVPEWPRGAVASRVPPDRRPDRRGLAAVAGLAACAPAATGAGWTFGPPFSPAPSAGQRGRARASAAASAAAVHRPPATTCRPARRPAASTPPVTGTIPAGWTEHDVAARDKVRRYVGDLAPAFKDIYPAPVFLKLAAILGVEDDYPALHQKPAFVQVPQLVLNDVLTPLDARGRRRREGLQADHRRDRGQDRRAPAAGRGARLQQVLARPDDPCHEGDKVRAEFTNNLKETTGVHFHGVEFDDFFQDGVPFVTQLPIVPGETYTYEFTAGNAGSLMYHSHHNATDQVGRGLLGAFIVDPKPEPVKSDRDYIWISNDELGGFTINGHGFPATVPVLAAAGETVRVRFMNEGIMMHPWHLHGIPMRVIARDGTRSGVPRSPATRWA